MMLDDGSVPEFSRYGGYVTVGTDSGHQNAPGVPLQAFALNDVVVSRGATASIGYGCAFNLELHFSAWASVSPPKGDARSARTPDHSSRQDRS